MLARIRNRHYFFLDFLFLILTPTLALGLRVNLPWDKIYNLALAEYTLLALLLKLPVFYAFGFYRHYWRYASIDEMLSILTGVGTTTVLVTGIAYALQGMGAFGDIALPRSVPLIDGLLTLLVVAGSRFSVRAFEYRKTRQGGAASKRVLIAGAGDAGQLVAREIRTSSRVPFELVGFVDDDPGKIGSVIHGVHVFGPMAKIPEIVKEYRVQEMIIAMPTVSGEIIRQIVALCDQAGVPTKTMPGLYEILSGRVSVNRLRPIEISDLLRREPVEVDAAKVEDLLGGKRVMVTGAGGSIGGELCTQITRCCPAQLIALGHGENSLFSLSSTLDGCQSQGIDLHLLVADVRDRPRLGVIFERYRPEIVFHAAAHKHVPMMEENIEDAVTNNILGTLNLVELSREHDVEHFVLISTDKAVKPVNVMGMTKRVAELVVKVVAAETGLPYVSVRFGNVLGSRGSVVPLFQRQIASGGPVTVTDPEMKRYFMTIPEAVQLVLQASTLGRNGEVFVLDMGEPVKIEDLAKDMIELSGYQVGEGIEIEYTGIRPGERLFEKLFADDETYTRTKHEKIFVTLNGAIPSQADFKREIDTLISMAREGETERLREKLSRLANLDL